MQLSKGIEAKILRASESIDAITHEISEFNSNHKYEIFYLTENDAKEHVTLVKGQSYPPLKISVLTGEVIFHLRSSLDHLIFALAQSNGSEPANNSQFPICSTREKFNQLVESGNLIGVPENIVSYIESKQPYNVEDSLNSTLLLIQELNNTDKHRLLNVVCAAARLGEEIVYEDNPNCKEQIDEPVELCYISPPNRAIVTPEGAETCRLKFNYSCPQILPRVKVSVDFVFDKCGTNDYVPLIDSLDKMKRFTEALTKEIYELL